MSVITKTEKEKLVNAKTRTRRAQYALNTSRYLAVANGSLFVPMTIAWLFFPQYTQLLWFAVAALVAGAGAGIYPLFHRRNQAALGASIFIVSWMISVFAVPLLIPQVMVAAGIAYAVIATLCYLLLGTKKGFWIIGLAIMAFTIDMILVATVAPSWFVPLNETVALVAGVFVGLVALVVSMIVAYIVVAGHEAYFGQSEMANLEIEESADIEREQRKSLEQASLEIEKRVTVEKEQREKLQQILGQVSDAANELNAATAEILAATTQQMSGASEQSAAISQTTTTVDEVKVIADQSVARAQEVADMSQRTVEVSRAGAQAVDDTIGSMGQIKDQVESIAENILTLSQHTQQIRDIISTVNDLASQSNMLALNAAVEAARAGEHGKGFAVVAAEVRSLADQSKQATSQVRTILEDIQRATNTTVMATEEGTKRADAGVRLAAQSGEAIRQLAGVIGESSQAAMQMVAGGRQQASGIEQIALAMQNINQATTQSLSSTRQAERAARDLNDLARSLSEIVVQ